MGYSLDDIARQLRDSQKRVQLIYAFNGTGKTRLSRAFKQLLSPGDDADDVAPLKVLYYNAFTEDLFYWDNDLEGDTEHRLIIRPSSYTRWALVDQGQDRNAIDHFQRYTHDKLTPNFSPDFSEVRFSFERGNAERSDYIKISRGEESVFIWSIFFAAIEQVIDVLNVAEPSDRETRQFDQLEYIFIDDPVSSLDENHLIEVAVDLATLIRSSESELRFIVTTHNPLFYNVLFNELGKARKLMLTRQESDSYELVEQVNDSPFSFHLFLLRELEKATATGQVHKYHFNFLRNILEKTSTFLGRGKWSELLPPVPGGKSNPYATRIVNISSHSKHAGDEVRELTNPEKQMVKVLLDHLRTTYGFRQEEIPHD